MGLISMDATANYEVKLEVFQGPLDLLLFLIRKKKIDIHDIPIATITREYLEYLQRKERINLDREAEFLLMAALLICIKSQMLLPREKVLDEEERDPRQVLVDRLVDYQRLKAASFLLKEKEEKEILRWKRTSLPPLLAGEGWDWIEVSLFDLAESFFALLKRKEREGIKTLKGKEYSLEEKMKGILALLQEKEFFDFLGYFSQQESIEEAMVAFLSLLELIKAGMVIAVQEAHFQSIKVWLRRKVEVKSH